MADGEELLEEEAEADRVDRRHEDVEERHVLVVLEHVHDAVPRVHAAHVKVHVVAPHVTNVRQLTKTQVSQSDLIS